MDLLKYLDIRRIDDLYTRFKYGGVALVLIIILNFVMTLNLYYRIYYSTDNNVVAKVKK